MDKTIKVDRLLEERLEVSASLFSKTYFWFEIYFNQKTFLKHYLKSSMNISEDIVIGPDHVCSQYEGGLEKEFFQCLDQMFCIPIRYRWDHS